MLLYGTVVCGRAARLTENRGLRPGQKEARAAAQDMLLAAAAAAQKKTEQSFAVVWAEGGRQAALEQAAGVGEFDYPALAVVGAKKKVSGFGLALALPWRWL